MRADFNAIAQNYDRFNDLITMGLHRRWKRQVILHTGLCSRQRATAVDLCAGTGDLTLMLARELTPHSRVIAIDISSAMLSILEKRIQRARQKMDLRKRVGEGAASSLASIEIVRADALQLTALGIGAVDAITIGFGLRNIQDRATALEECYRLLQPGGRLVLLDVGRVENPFIRPFSQIYFERIVPLIGCLSHGKKEAMYAYLPASAKAYPPPQAISEELRAAGFEEVHHFPLLFGQAAIHRATRPAGHRPARPADYRPADR